MASSEEELISFINLTWEVDPDCRAIDFSDDTGFFFGKGSHDDWCVFQKSKASDEGVPPAHTKVLKLVNDLVSNEKRYKQFFLSDFDTVWWIVNSERHPSGDVTELENVRINERNIELIKELALKYRGHQREAFDLHLILYLFEIAEMNYRYSKTKNPSTYEHMFLRTGIYDFLGKDCKTLKDVQNAAKEAAKIGKDEKRSDGKKGTKGAETLYTQIGLETAGVRCFNLHSK